MVKKTSISLDEETFHLCEKYVAENSKSRSEFIAAAIQRRTITMKILENIKNYTYRRRHMYKLCPVIVDGINFNVMNVTPHHMEDIPKKVKDILKYLINGK